MNMSKNGTLSYLRFFETVNHMWLVALNTCTSYRYDARARIM